MTRSLTLKDINRLDEQISRLFEGQIISEMEVK